MLCVECSKYLKILMKFAERCLQLKGGVYGRTEQTWQPFNSDSDVLRNLCKLQSELKMKEDSEVGLDVVAMRRRAGTGAERRRSMRSQVVVLFAA